MAKKADVTEQVRLALGELLTDWTELLLSEFKQSSPEARASWRARELPLRAQSIVAIVERNLP